MYPDLIPSDRLPRESSNPFQFHGPNDGSADNHAVPALPNAPPPNSNENPEFTKWWRRWVSRVRLTARRNPAARRFQIGRNNNDKNKDRKEKENGRISGESKVAQANGTDRLSASGTESGREKSGRESGSPRESGDTFNTATFNRTDCGEVRHRNNIPPATRAISGEAEFKRYLL
ncbi:MAG: hypothetical protein WB983_18040 [Terriglobales bacterium]